MIVGLVGTLLPPSSTQSDPLGKWTGARLGKYEDEMAGLIGGLDDEAYFA